MGFYEKGHDSSCSMQIEFLPQLNNWQLLKDPMYHKVSAACLTNHHHHHLLLLIVSSSFNDTDNINVIMEFLIM
jgi:hypothetical protein